MRYGVLYEVNGSANVKEFNMKNKGNSYNRAIITLSHFYGDINKVKILDVYKLK